MTPEAALPAHTGVVALLDANPVVGEQKRGPRRFWTTREIALLREHWSSGGIEVCLPLLPGRTASAIYGQACKLGLVAPETVRRGVPQHRHTTTEFIDAAIRRTYQGTPTKGDIKRLATTVMRPRHWVRKRAELLGCALPRFKEPNWTPEELALLEKNEGKKPDAIARILARHGFRRTASAVGVMMVRHSVSRVDPDLMTARGLAALLGVDGKTVTRLIEKQGLPAVRAGTARTAAQGGDEWRIKRRDLRRFVIENPYAVDLRKVDPVWFIDLLARPK